MADTEVVGDAGACASYLDEALFPYCFYARLLQTQGAASSVPPATLSASLHTSALLQAQKLRVDEDDVAIRLAGRLRERTARAHGSLQGLCSVPPGNLVAPFCDPTVEEQQAQLHSELTAFLLEVRRKNLASVQLRHQLQHSRAVQARLHDNGRLFFAVLRGGVIRSRVSGKKIETFLRTCLSSLLPLWKPALLSLHTSERYIYIYIQKGAETKEKQRTDNWRQMLLKAAGARHDPLGMNCHYVLRATHLLTPIPDYCR
ncbi:LOW QUALITY PROTEIN: conserved hypothetical protein [Leishmania braziliensis MHOM/BR/75/M2904]|uniref:Uncharacterized protein n=1 Tax=Leishmania braziliensis TaxID=5660 RepID=E9AIX1_LEIBR|nr:LOW QUALITY PROTEIN: conserved hypothetical protein [Leishmania braziliensis MHOM/BR/75/M2904]CBZ14847.1 conserved hypothetical protein [Leishmania braziliensis MHOM/BR/75/M2904]